MQRLLLFLALITVSVTLASPGHAIEAFSEPMESGTPPPQSMTVKPVSANYTFSAADSGQFIDFSSAGIITATIADESEPDVSGTHYPEGTVLTWGMRGGGTLVITGNNKVSFIGNTHFTNAMGSAIRFAPGQWYIGGGE